MATIALPGDVVAVPDDPAALRLGPGLTQLLGAVTAVKAGLVCEDSGNRLWLNASQKRYIPSVGEPVLAVVQAKHAENFRVDIGGPHPALLPVLAFEGATKRNRPNLDVGALVYARVSLANKDMDPEIECVNPATSKADGFGELKGGTVVKCSLGMCRSLMAKNSPILEGLSSLFPFETAIGMNGRVWINAETTRQIVLAANFIRAADGAPPSRIPSMLKALKKRVEETDDGDDMDADS
ncbi:exosome non-catalytic core subunit rrp40 [Polyrhizophydium stewartii]|uniref:Ribosomal RNA-processing protein 40 n=1 Tax=Polyrhizophydium stewartii TaxID=2732419 RepID=A0ABR4NJ79_9FUNG